MMEMINTVSLANERRVVWVNQHFLCVNKWILLHIICMCTLHFFFLLLLFVSIPVFNPSIQSCYFWLGLFKTCDRVPAGGRRAAVPPASTRCQRAPANGSLLSGFAGCSAQTFSCHRFSWWESPPAGHFQRGRFKKMYRTKLEQQNVDLCSPDKSPNQTHHLLLHL